MSSEKINAGASRPARYAEFMKAVAVFPARRQVQLIDHPEPNIKSPAQVKVRVLDIGVCGTDREITSFQYGTPPDGSDYPSCIACRSGRQDFCCTGDFTERGIKQRHGYMIWNSWSVRVI
jgi:hypothetical protein